MIAVGAPATVGLVFSIHKIIMEAKRDMVATVATVIGESLVRQCNKVLRVTTTAGTATTPTPLSSL